jgi:S1-C subfamily serine protease
MSESPPHRPAKLLARGSVKIRIALASAVALALGAWLTPAVEPTNISPPQEHAAPLLEEQVQLREINRPFVGVQDIALRVKPHSVTILKPMPPPIPSRTDYSELANVATRAAGFGVFVSDTHVLTHAMALDGESSVDLALENATTRRARVVAYEPTYGLALLQTDPSGKPSVAMAAERPAAGALAVAVGRADDRDLAVPVFITSVGADRYTIGAVGETLMPGMPLFTLDGELFAIAAPDGPEVRAIPVRQMAAKMMARAAAGENRSSFGLGIQAPAGALAAVFGKEGVIVSEVLAGGPADTADIVVGDILLAVGEVEIDSVDTAARALSTANLDTPVTLRVRRADRVSDVTVTPAPAYEVAALSRAATETVRAPEARILFPAALLEAQPIAPAAQVISVDGRPATTRVQVQRVLRTARTAIPVLLRHGDRQFFVAIEPVR